jgi:hypothetical protein
MSYNKTINDLQLMTFHEVNTRIDQPMGHDIHRSRLGRGEYHVPWVDQSLYSPKLNTIFYDRNVLVMFAVV